MPVKIFFCYAHEDELLLNKLKTHLRPLQRMGLIETWHDRDISAGTKWEEEIDKHLNEANIILLLVSPDFMDSDYCYGKEMQRALERDQRGEARVIPIILRPVYWQGVLGTLQALPTDARPVMSSSWQYHDEAFFNVTEGIRKVVMHLTSPHASDSPVIAETMPQAVTKTSLTGPPLHQSKNKAPVLFPLPVERLTLLLNLKDHIISVLCVAISPDGQTLVSGSLDHTIKVWELSTGKLMRTLTGHELMVDCVAISPDGQTLVSGSLDHTIKVWELSTGKLMRTLTGHKDGVTCVAISPDGQTLVSGGAGDDATIKVWELSTGKLMCTLTGHKSGLTYVAIRPDGQTLVSDGGHDKMIKVWELSTGKLMRTLTSHEGYVACAAISPNGQTLVSGSEDGTIKVWELSIGKLMRTLTAHEGYVGDVAISPDGQTLVSGGAGDHTIKVWELSTGKLMRTLTAQERELTCVAISPDGQTLVSGGAGDDATIKVWGV